MKKNGKVAVLLAGLISVASALVYAANPSPTPSSGFNGYYRASSVFDGGMTINGDAGIIGNARIAGRVTSYFNENGSVSTGHANFEVVGNPAASSPGLAAFDNCLEIGGKAPNPAGVFADVYIGAMQLRTAGPIAEVLNSYGLAGEVAVWAAWWDGDTHQNGHVILGENKSDGRVSTANGSLYLIAANGAHIVWNKGAQDVVQFYSGAGATQVATISAAGRAEFTSYSGYTNNRIFYSETAPTISSGFGTSPIVSVANGTASFRINVGTGGVATSGNIGLPAATNGWNCTCTDKTTTSSTVFLCKQTGGTDTTTAVSLGNFNTSGTAAAWNASDILLVSCFGN